MFSYPIDDTLSLRILERRHAEALFQLTDDNRAHLRRFLMWPDDILSVADARGFIRDGLDQYARNDGFQAGIFEDDTLIGCIGFHSVNWHDRNTEVGYWLAEAYTHRGIMTRATHAMVDYAFNVLYLHRVEIRCAAENHASRAIPQRLGFTEEGVMRQQLWLHDRYVDHVVYGVLSAEWRKLHGPPPTGDAS